MYLYFPLSATGVFSTYHLHRSKHNVCIRSKGGGDKTTGVGCFVLGMLHPRSTDTRHITYLSANPPPPGPAGNLSPVLQNPGNRPPLCATEKPAVLVGLLWLLVIGLPPEPCQWGGLWGGDLSGWFFKGGVTQDGPLNKAAHKKFYASLGTQRKQHWGKNMTCNFADNLYFRETDKNMATAR